MKIIKKLLKDEKGSAIVDVGLSISFLLGLFIGFLLYSNAVRTKLVMNYAAKEGARVYAITKDESEGLNATNSYLRLGVVNFDDTEVRTVDNNGIRIENDLNLRNPFLHHGDNIKLKSEFVFFEEYVPDYYDRGYVEGNGWLSEPVKKERVYDDDSDKR